MGGSKPGFYQGSPVAEGRIMGNEGSSLGPLLWVLQAEGHLAFTQSVKELQLLKDFKKTCRTVYNKSVWII